MDTFFVAGLLSVAGIVLVAVSVMGLRVAEDEAVEVLAGCGVPSPDGGLHCSQEVGHLGWHSHAGDEWFGDVWDCDHWAETLEAEPVEQELTVPAPKSQPAKPFHGSPVVAAEKVPASTLVMGFLDRLRDDWQYRRLQRIAAEHERKLLWDHLDAEREEARGGAGSLVRAGLLAVSGVALAYVLVWAGGLVLTMFIVLAMLTPGG